MTKKSKIAKAGADKYKMDKPPTIPMKPFNIGKQVFNYFIALKLQAHFTNQGNPIQLHFGGLVQGYDDWFEALVISQEEFDAVRARAVDEKNLDDEVRKLIPKFEEQWRKFLGKVDNKMLTLMSEADPMKVKALMDGFKSKLKEK